MKTLVVIPAYNEALNIEKTVHDLEVNAPEVDYVVVNDNLEKVIADEIIASKELAENIDGTSGKAIYRYFAEELIKEDIYNG